ncbi:fibronectin type III domain-containing protein, partial [bacterium]|nr:fibronectin type III domain-containing protein [bacterium]
YYVKLRARNPKLSGSWSSPISITTLPYKPGTAPKGLTISDGGQTGVLLRWQKIKSALGYDLACGTDPLAGNMGILPTEENSFSLQLSPNSRYFFKVRSIIKGAAGPWSAIQSLLTLPAKPRGLNVSAQTSDQAVISWRSLPGSRISRFYHINWGTNSKGTNLGLTVTANASYTFSRLKPSRRYYVRIRTVNQSGVSPWGKVLSFTTLSPGLSGVRISKLKQNSSEVKWNIMSAAQAYEISYGSDIEARTHRLDEVSRPPAKIQDLIPDTIYYLKIRPLMQNRQPGAWSNIINFTTFPIPPKPKNISLAEIGGTYVRLTWTPEEQINTYEVLLSAAESPDQNQPQVFNHSDVRLTRLNKNTNYSVKIRAANLGGPGSWSLPQSFTTLPEIPPSLLMLSKISPHDAMLTWEAISGNAYTTYQIRVGPAQKTWRVISKHAAQTLNLSQLQPETKYRVQVRAQNNTGLGPWSREVTFHTPPAPPDRAPQNLAVTKITDISTALHWQAMKKVDGYHLSIGTNTDASNRGQKILHQTSHDLKSLIPNTTYFVKIRAYNITGEGPWSDILLVTTRPTPPFLAPTKTKISEVTIISITFTWETAPGVSSYEVSIGTDAQGTNRGQPQSTNSPPYIFSNCKPATQYSVKVRSLNSGGAGPWSRIIKATTLKQ